MHRRRGFSIIELLPAIALILLASMAAVAWVSRSTQHADWTRDKVFARQKAMSILAELRSYVEGGDGEVAADLDGFDDGLGAEPSLTIAPDPDDPGAFVPPQHPLSGNNFERGSWRWARRITVRPFPGVNTRDLRICTVRMFRQRPTEAPPGELQAEISTVIRTVGDAYPTTQVYDVYLLALENVPGWWVYMDAIQPFIEATFSDLESRNPGLVFRTHWITKLGYGRDAAYAPYTNEQRTSIEETPWAYVYPGRMPEGYAAQRYYVPERMQARVNLDGASAPEFANGYSVAEAWSDLDGNGRRDPGEPFDDEDLDGRWDAGNPHPYALADMHNHCLRYPEAAALHQARVDAGVEEEDVLTWRLLLDSMVDQPDRFHNAILINLHGELLPMPPARNVSDAAKDPENRPGWRAVTHPERLRPRRTQGSDAQSDMPRFRVYAYKSEFHGTETVTTQGEPYTDSNGNGAWDDGESFLDWNNNAVWDPAMPITIRLANGDFSGAPNDATAPSLRVLKLSGGVDGDGDAAPDDYVDWAQAARYPETFTDTNDDGILQIAEPWLDLDGDGLKGDDEPWQELDGDGAWTSASEAVVDGNGNGRFDPAAPAESFSDSNGNGRWDAAEPYWDADGDTLRTPASAPITPWRAWQATDGASPEATAAYVAAYGEPFLDVDGDAQWDDEEPFAEWNGNRVCDGGYARGEMWYEIAYEAGRGTLLHLHTTPLEAPYLDDAGNVRKGVRGRQRLYDLDYVPCPTPSSATGADRFARDLFTSSGGDPKNTARWILELPLAAVRTVLESATGSGDGDASDQLLEMETWLGRVDPGATTSTATTSTTYAYFYEDVEDVPYSERFQFLGDPRHCPYADLDRTGTTAPNGYNWFFDDLRDGSYDYQARWLAFDAPRLRDRWRGRCCHDVPRLMAWLRTALARTEAVYTTLTGFSYYYLSVGGDVGYDSANGFPDSIPMDGAPFGSSGDVFENTITDGNGTSTVRGSLKHVRSSTGTATGIRSGGYWWSKPWLGELCPDASYVSQWVPWGNLRAGPATSADVVRLVRRGSLVTAQQPRGTTLVNSYARLKEEGSTSLFNVGTSSATFHHQYCNGQTGSLVEDGPQLAQNYNFPLPSKALISRPFGLATSGSGGVGDEFAYLDAYPRFFSSMIRRFYNHQSGQTGSGLVLLEEPSGSRAGFVVVNGIDRTIESGSAFISRYAALTLIHSFFAAGAPGADHRIRQLPRVQILQPTLITELEDPSSVQVTWSTEWRRWDGLPYTDSYPTGHAEDEADLLYVPMVSADGGKTWRDMRQGLPVEPGRIPWVEGVGADPSRTLRDDNPGADESFVWDTPVGAFPKGSYLIRVETYRSSEALHYSHHQEKIYVNR